MRRILLSVGVPAGVLRFAKENRPAIFRTRRFLFPKAAANLKKTCRAASLFLVCPPGLEPGPGASEALMVSNSTTGTFFGTSGTISPFGKPFSFFSIYFTLFRFIFASVYAIIFLNFSKNFSPARLLRIFSCIHRLKNS